MEEEKEENKQKKVKGRVDVMPDQWKKIIE